MNDFSLNGGRRLMVKRSEHLFRLDFYFVIYFINRFLNLDFQIIFHILILLILSVAVLIFNNLLLPYGCMVNLQLLKISNCYRQEIIKKNYLY